MLLGGRINLGMGGGGRFHSNLYLKGNAKLKRIGEEGRRLRTAVPVLLLFPSSESSFLFFMKFKAFGE
jgi:hypothetical protein